MFQVTRNIVLIGLMTSLTCIGSFVRIPVFSVPITLQTLFVYLSGTLLGRWQGFISQVLYLIIGLAGIPVFTFGGGPASILKPTFGYLLGFPAAAWVVGALFHIPSVEPIKIGRMLASLFTGMLIILLTGTTGLMINAYWNLGKPVDLSYVLWTGVLLFVPVEIIKIFITSRLVIKLRPILKSINT